MSFTKKVMSGTCPNCGKTKLFYDKGNIFLFRLPKMNNSCSECNYNFHRETGFYFGAMYVSYGLTVAQMIAVMVIGLLFNISVMNMFIVITLIAFLLFTFNYRISRIIWLNIFYKKE